MPVFPGASNFTINGGIFIDNQGDSATVGRIKEILENDERQKIMAWVSHMDVSAKQSDVASIRQPGTGEWFLNSNVFQEWERGTGRALWCPGIPGAGKTVLTSLIIDHLRTFQLREPLGTIGVAWIYYNYKEELTQTPDAIHLSLIRQLARFSAELCTLLESSYRRDFDSRPSAQQLISDLRILGRIFVKFFIIVDALDECAESSRDTFLEIMTRFQTSGANVLITSRHRVYDSISHSGLVGVQRIDIRGSTDDVTKFVNIRLIKQRRLAQIIRTDPTLHDEIIRVIVSLCEGMFLMATFHVESLGKHINPGRVRDALKALPSTFPGIYDEAMHRIESDDDHSEDALRILSFLIHARKPLTLTELQHFLAVNPDDTDFHDEYITDKDILLSICAGLVVIDDATRIVRLVHFTTQEYFDKIRASKFPLGDREMGHVCLTYLSFNTFKDIANLSDESDQLSHYSLLDYIVHHWYIHISNHQEALQSLLWNFFTDAALLRAYCIFLEKYRSDYFDYQRSIIGHTGLHIAAAAGLSLVASWLIVDAAINSKDSTGKTPLIYSSGGGYTKTVDLLITNGADVNVKDMEDGAALQAASRGGYKAVVKLLLENGADVSAQGERYGSALIGASSYGHEAVMELLLENGADINARASHYGTALMVASRGGHATSVKLLLKHGAHINAQAGDHGTALMAASKGGHEATVKLLLENGADINAGDELQGTALIQASEGGHESVVKLLLENGVDVNAQAKHYGTALMAASNGGKEAVVKLLLGHGADINAQSGYFHTALTAASQGGHEAVVKLLFENGGDIGALGGHYGTTLTAASSGGHEAVVKLLLDHGAKISTRSEYYGAELIAASAHNNVTVVKLLLEHGADINAQAGDYDPAVMAASCDDYGTLEKLLLGYGAHINAQAAHYATALIAASSGGHEAAVKLLLENGADVNAQAGHFGTALIAASEGGHETVVKLLLENGANINAQGGDYGTALMAATEYNNTTVVELLLENGANLSPRDEGDRTAFLEASEGGHEAVVMQPIEHNADVDTWGGECGTAP